MANRVVRFLVLGKDPDALRDFYRRVFDWNVSDGITSTGANYGTVEAGKGGVAGGIGYGQDRSVSVATFVVEVEDLAAMISRAESLGGKTVRPQTRLEGLDFSLAYLADPEGHVVELATGLSSEPGGNSSNSVRSFEVMGRDSASLLRFYSSLFGWKTSEAPFKGYWNVDPGEGIPGGIGPARAAGLRDGSGFATFKVEVDNTDAVLAKVAELGGKAIMPTYAVPGTGLKIAYFADPEGHIVGLTSGLR